VGSVTRAWIFRPNLFALAVVGLLTGCSTATLPTLPYRSPAATAPAELRSQIATASWYGPGFNGRRTASGEIFHQTDLTAASRTLPMGCRVKVTNLANCRSVVVKITDRGPFVSGRNIDLSRTAAERIGIAREGVGTVRISRPGDHPAGIATVCAPAPAEIPVSYAGLSGTSSRVPGAWLVPRREWIRHVKVTFYHLHHRRRRRRHRAGVVSNPVRTWLMSALPHF
jgi:rare lipoprotein A